MVNDESATRRESVTAPERFRLLAGKREYLADVVHNRDSTTAYIRRHAPALRGQLWRQTVLQAVQRAHRATFMMALEHVDFANTIFRISALIACITSGRFDYLSALMFANLQRPTEERFQPDELSEGLIAAVHRGDETFIGILIMHGGSPTYTAPDDEYTPLDAAVHVQSRCILQLLYSWDTRGNITPAITARLLATAISGGAPPDMIGFLQRMSEPTRE